MSKGYADQKYYQVSACLGEMVSSDDETDLENCRQISEVTVASTADSAESMVSHQFADMYPRKDGYVVKNYQVEEL